MSESGAKKPDKKPDRPVRPEPVTPESDEAQASTELSGVTTEIPFAGDSEEKATLLLAAAEELNLPPDVVRVSGGHAFIAPKEVVDKAGLSEGTDIATQVEYVRRAPEVGDPPESIKGGAGPTGETDTNAGQDAEMGTVQDTADENDAPRSNIEFVNEQAGEKSKRSSPSKAAGKKSESKNDAQE
jgi:hypothetical protein